MSPCPKDGRPDCPRAVEFVHAVQAALRANDRTAIAGMMKYPFLTTLHGKKVYIRARTQLLAHFDEIFDQGVRCSVLGAQDRDVWGRYDGFTVGLGAIWFDDRIPPGGNTDPTSVGFWKHPFEIVTVNNGSNYPCLSTHKTDKRRDR
jgi:hypothetical protein